MNIFKLEILLTTSILFHLSIIIIILPLLFNYTSAQVIIYKQDRVYRYIGNPSLHQEEEGESDPDNSSSTSSISINSNVGGGILNNSIDNETTVMMMADGPGIAQQQQYNEDENYEANLDSSSSTTPSSSQQSVESSVAQRTGIPDRIFIQINHEAQDVKDFITKFVEVDIRSTHNPDINNLSSSPQDHHDADDDGENTRMDRKKNKKKMKTTPLPLNNEDPDDKAIDRGNHDSDKGDNDHDVHEDHDEDEDEEEGHEVGVHVESLFRGYGISTSDPDPGSGSQSSSSSSSSPASGSASGSSSGSAAVGGRRSKQKIPRTISTPAGCDVEMRTIEIKDPLAENELYYPWCVRIPRCSGCCPSIRLRCVPTNTSLVEINAVRLQYAKFNEKFRYEGMRSFKLEKHDACRCECVQQSTDCNEHQEYRQDECRCVCRDPERAVECAKQGNKIWIQDSCRCKCRHKATCMTGTVFNEDTCRCHVPHESNQFSFNQFPLIHFHSSIDLEIKKQQDYNTRLGSSDGINPDSQGPEVKGYGEQQTNSFNQFILRDQ